MCGRFGVDENLVKSVKGQLAVQFAYSENMDIKPTNTVATLASVDGVLTQKNCKWGIKPEWSKGLIINAKAETAIDKPTFKESFKQFRCVVPMSCWYEWRMEGETKTKFQFSGLDHEILYMAGIYYITDDRPQLVTLTTSPTNACAEYHQRMPLLIPSANINSWLNSVEYAQYLSQNELLRKDDLFEITPQ